MSYSFHVPGTLPPIAELRSGLAVEGVECLEDDDASSDVEPSIWHLYVPERSGRGVEIERGDGEVSVRVSALASPADFELAFALVETLAKRGGGTFRGEDEDEDQPVANLRSDFDAEWVAKQTESSAHVVAHLVGEGQGPVTIPGILRPVCIGTRVLSELRDGGPDEGLAGRMVEKVRELQWIDLGDLHEAAEMIMKRESGKDVSFAVWAAGERYLFPPVNRLVLMVDPGGDAKELVWIPFEALHDVAGDALEQVIDECQAVVSATPPERWSARIAAARAHELAAPENEAKPRRPWWKFW